MISKIYFPRLIVPLSSVVTGFVDLAISILILAAMMVWYHFVPTWRITLLPAFLLLAAAAAIGGGIWLAALTVKYRDFRVVVPYHHAIWIFPLAARLFN